MRLLDTKTLNLHEFFGNAIPSYAILSHRWESEEVTFQDLRSARAPEMKGWSKISGCCAQAARDGCQYAWVDSCCIDKSSSSELSEAINSMYQWYQRSKVCYVYLSDVREVPTGRNGDTHHRKYSEFRRSKWFTRGWTLQELIAPKMVIFYDCSWRDIGTRRSMEKLISDITGIRPQHFKSPRSASVAQRMSWASKRETTRVEDQAYSLLGLFNVNMPPLYGEGWKAFRRLQLEILASSYDESIFAWNPIGKVNGEFRGQEGLLAHYPADFILSGDIITSKDNPRPPYYMTNRGLRMEAFLLPPNKDDPQAQYTVPLHCVREDDDKLLGVSISGAASTTDFQDCYELRRSGGLILVTAQKMPSHMTVIHIKQFDVLNLPELELEALISRRFVLATDTLLQSNFTVFRESWHDCRHQQTRVRRVLEYSEGDWGRQKSIGQRKNARDFKCPNQEGCNIVCLHFVSEAYVENGLMKVGSEDPDSFIIILDAARANKKETWVDIVIPQGSQSMGADVEAPLSIPVSFKGRTDRISRSMKSRRSVSVALRRRPEGFSFYVLDITIDPEGRLPWPALDE